MDVTITVPKNLLEQLYIAACGTEVEARQMAAMTARWEADRPECRDAATHAACKLEKAEHHSRWLISAAVAA